MTFVPATASHTPSRYRAQPHLLVRALLVTFCFPSQGEKLTSAHASTSCMQNLSCSLLVDSSFCNFVQTELLHGLPLDAPAFWRLLESTLELFVDKNEALIARREELQSKIDAFHILHRHSAPVTEDEYISFLTSIGYIEPPVAPFAITSHQSGLDSEINIVCGPQIVVPVTRARFALNAANSRWGSLYDVLCVRAPYFTLKT